MASDGGAHSPISVGKQGRQEARDRLRYQSDASGSGTVSQGGPRDRVKPCACLYLVNVGSKIIP